VIGRLNIDTDCIVTDLTGQTELGFDVTVSIGTSEFRLYENFPSPILQRARSLEIAVNGYPLKFEGNVLPTVLLSYLQNRNKRLEEKYDCFWFAAACNSVPIKQINKGLRLNLDHLNHVMSNKPNYRQTIADYLIILGQTNTNWSKNFLYFHSQNPYPHIGTMIETQRLPNSKIPFLVLSKIGWKNDIFFSTEDMLGKFYPNDFQVFLFP
jgi:hypothetical protein